MPRALRAILAIAILGTTQLGVLVGPAVAWHRDVVLLYFPHDSDEPRFRNNWGEPRSDDRRHRGIDIFDDKGTPVVAVADGVVVGLEEGGRGGFYVRLEHEGGWESWYMHLNNDTPGTDDGRGGPQNAFAFGMEVGDVVAAGQLIGYVGDSGNAESSSPHTHFEIRVNSVQYNPYHLLEDAIARGTRAQEMEGVVY